MDILNVGFVDRLDVNCDRENSGWMDIYAQAGGRTALPFPIGERQVLKEQVSRTEAGWGGGKCWKENRNFLMDMLFSAQLMSEWRC